MRAIPDPRSCGLVASDINASSSTGWVVRFFERLSELIRALTVNVVDYSQVSWNLCVLPSFLSCAGNYLVAKMKLESLLSTLHSVLKLLMQVFFRYPSKRIGRPLSTFPRPVYSRQMSRLHGEISSHFLRFQSSFLSPYLPLRQPTHMTQLITGWSLNVFRNSAPRMSRIHHRQMSHGEIMQVLWSGSGQKVCICRKNLNYNICLCLPISMQIWAARGRPTYNCQLRPNQAFTPCSPEDTYMPSQPRYPSQRASWVYVL